MAGKVREVQEPWRIRSYFKLEKWTLVFITISGIFYNIGMTAGPWFEGTLAQYLCDIIAGRKNFSDMARLAFAYVAVIFLVQAMRFVKRLYVRKFANHMNRDMKHVLYHSLVQKPKVEFETEQTGAIMTKAISDVDTCVEGVRKFTTEIFDTGVVMIAYLVMLFSYDWRLTLLSMIFPPIAYIIAERLKKPVSASAAAYKESAGRLNDASLERVKHALTYRVYGQEQNQNIEYEKSLDDYEKRAIQANIWETSMQPLYQIISMMGVLVILWFGAKNVMGTGWKAWDIAAFMTFLSCFTKLAVKSSKAAKLFNAVQKAHVSWRRICPLLKETDDTDEPEQMQDVKQEKKHLLSESKLKVEDKIFYQNKKETSVLSDTNLEQKQKEPSVLLDVDLEQKKKKILEEVLSVKHLSFAYPDKNKITEYAGKNIFTDVSFSAKKGEIIGVTGAVASGKSTFGRVFLCESAYQGNIFLEGQDFSERMKAGERLVSYVGHQPELLDATIRENILLGETGDVWNYLRAVCMEKEVEEMPDGVETKIGNGGMRLSGGQQARIALARALCHKAPIVVLDDPFSAVDKKTEKELFANLRAWTNDCIVFLISHRLTLFPELEKILWIEQGNIVVSNHETLMQKEQSYRTFYQMQAGGKHTDENSQSEHKREG